MADKLMTTAVCAKFALTSREKASTQIRRFADKYLELAAGLDAVPGAVPVTVPLMGGVDEDMRNWSYFMLLEHNTIVNRCMTDIVHSLAEGREPTGAGTIDPKTDVMPGLHPGPEQIEAFQQSIEDHLSLVPTLGQLRGTAVKRHPIFGDFDAHQWHCMVGFHLMIHLKQAKLVAREALATAGKDKFQPVKEDQDHDN
jgi:hypothetical protein